MAFEKIVKQNSGDRSFRDPNRIGMSCTKVGRGKLAARLIFAGGVMSRMSLGPKSKIDIERGTNEDAGLLRVSRSDGAGFILQSLKGATTVHGPSTILALAALAAKEPHRAAPVEYEIKDGAIYITLPEWARQ